ncbi:contact-dependent growth inhibition system immunity protein [Bacillus arachidis]|uniref:contact-dependent growth inhibition system immunity protein n=1 Tax=Bacillus arachidis TaxID=2819290 RepID=UPI00255C9E56|nr:contact-dependent growth inhibition system immunity protein [Bacillus arachidis]WIY63158.1 contact-dependent growth inhibition system immunity protein [Bacillus arachidis]
MDGSYDVFEELGDFLGGTFHQDMNSPEEALEEFICESSKECLLFTIKYCEEFLNSEITVQEKGDFIESNAEIYFPAIGLTPVQWLISTVEQMKKSL